MSERQLSNEQAMEAWTGIAKSHGANLKRMQQQREQCEQTLALLGGVLKRRSATMPLEVYRFYQIAETLQKKMLAFIDLAALSDTAFPNANLKPQIELVQLEMQFLTTQAEAIHFGRLYNVAHDDLALAVAGKPPTRALPKIWAGRRDQLARDQAWREALERFLVEMPAFVEGVKAIEGIWPELEASPPKDRFAALKELNVAALAGHSFRIRGIFRMLEGGEAFLDAFGVGLPKAPKPRGDGKKITDRLTGIFRGTNG